MALGAGVWGGGRVPPGLWGFYSFGVVLPGFLLCSYALLLPGFVPVFLGVGLLVVWLVFGFTSCFWLLVGVVWVWVWWFFCC